MNPAWRHMAMSVFDKQDPEELSIEEIDHAIAKYPYFTVLHFIKASKLGVEKSPDAVDATTKAALYFPNPQWLQYQLKADIELDEGEESLAEILTTHQDLPKLAGSEEDHLSPAAEIMQENEEEVYDAKRVYKTQNQFEQDIVVPAVEMGSEDGIIIDDIVPAVEIIESDDQLEDEIVPATEINEPDDQLEDEIVPAVETTWEDPAIPDEVVPAIETDNVVTALKEPYVPEQDTSLIPIEPLYTIDYFASQGIKLPTDEIPTDQLGKKLKSFTEWLKSMKKLQPEKLDRQMDHETENHIRRDAEYSNEGQEVYTEALADVYLKQGLHDRAVDVFKKLSLLDPSKSAYFAARIREIKEI